jgi:hypothetical protein
VPAKFQIGDRVRFTDRANNVSGLRKMTRKIVGTYYSKKLQATLYELGGRGGKHRSGQWHRSYELYLVQDRQARKIGRPNTKVRKALRGKRQGHQTNKARVNITQLPKSQNGKASQAIKSKSTAVTLKTE